MAAGSLCLHLFLPEAPLLLTAAAAGSTTRFLVAKKAAEKEEELMTCPHALIVPSYF
jgi:hypothetical protein